MIFLTPFQSFLHHQQQQQQTPSSNFNLIHQTPTPSVEATASSSFLLKENSNRSFNESLNKRLLFNYSENNCLLNSIRKRKLHIYQEVEEEEEEEEKMKKSKKGENVSLYDAWIQTNKFKQQNKETLKQLEEFESIKKKKENMKDASTSTSTISIQQQRHQETIFNSILTKPFQQNLNLFSSSPSTSLDRHLVQLTADNQLKEEEAKAELDVNTNQQQPQRKERIEEDDRLPREVLEYKRQSSIRCKYLEKKWFDNFKTKFEEEKQKEQEKLAKEESRHNFHILKQIREKKQKLQEEQFLLISSASSSSLFSPLYSSLYFPRKTTSQLYSHLVFKERKQRQLEEEKQLAEEEEDDLFEDDQLSEDHQAMKEEIMSRSIADSKVYRADCEIRRKDLETLSSLNWLNDEVINEFFTLLENSSENQVKTFSTFFFSKLSVTGHKGVKRWTKKIDIFSYSLLLFPIHLSIHWTLIAVDMNKKQIRFFDSLYSQQTAKEAFKHLQTIHIYLREEFKERKGDTLDDFELIVEKDCPQQMNGSDCGMFCCKFAQQLAQRKPIHHIKQSRMPVFRDRMIVELVVGELLPSNERRKSHSSQTNKRIF